MNPSTIPPGRRVRRVTPQWLLATKSFILGAIGFVDHDGYVPVTDRSDDLVLSGGVNVYPAEAERVLSAHPAVADVACIGLPDDETGERLVALVEAPRTKNTWPPWPPPSPSATLARP